MAGLSKEQVGLVEIYQLIFVTIRGIQSTQMIPKPHPMLKNYLLTAFRTLIRNRTYSSINIFGLAIGLACFILIALFVQDEWQYESFHLKSDRIFRLSSINSARTAPKLAHTIAEDFPEVEQALRLMRYKGILKFGEDQYFEDDFYFAPPEVFDVFTFEFIHGVPKSALSGPNQVVLTERIALKYFGTTDVIGQNLSFLDTILLNVTGVIKDLPSNTHFKVDILASFENYQQMGYDLDVWSNNVYYTYVLLKAGTDPELFKKKLEPFLDRHVRHTANFENYSLEAMAIRDIHLHSDKRMEMEPNGKLSYIYIFSSIAFIVLLIAGINFMNLATALATRRAKEIGVRKTIGARFYQLLIQFLSESTVMSTLAMIVALSIVAFALPWLNQIADKSIDYAVLFHPGWLIALGGLTMIVGLLAGLYPAFVLSSYRPNEVLKGKIRTAMNQLWLRKGLVVFQFALSAILIVGMGVVVHQLSFMKNQSLGFDQEQVLVLPYFWDGKVQEEYETIKAEMLSIPSVESVTASGDIPGRMSTTMSFWAEGMPEDRFSGIQALYIDKDFIPTYGMTMIAGRAFDNQIQSDLEYGYVLNEQAVREIGWTPEEAIGKRFSVHNDGRVIGVVQDFHYFSLQQQIRPLVIALRPDWCGYISLRVNTEGLDQTLSNVEQRWKSIVPDRPLDYYFLDEDFNRQYLSEQKLSRIISIFSFLAVLIAAIGLFGLATFSIENRIKEIAIRKVLGASVGNIVLLLTRDFSRLVFLAIMIGCPLAYWLMQSWLNQFAYQIEISPKLFLLAGSSLILVAILAISIQSTRAAFTNPKEWLKAE